MHLHILGICGSFMGGLAAIAKAAGHTVTGCDANVYPPMSTQLEGLGIALTQGYDPMQLDTVARSADVFVVGNAISRRNPLLPAVHLRAAVAVRERVTRQVGARGRRNARQDDRDRVACLDS
jgi:UDP-N-acetylmuramate-alanine ligase